MVYKLITAPTALAITLATAKNQCNIEQAFTDDDVLLESYINAATAYVEKLIQGPLMEQIWELQMSDFKSCIEIRKTFVSEITSVSYYNTSEADTPVNASNYLADLASVPARILLKSAYAWPSVYDRFDAVRVRFKAGFSSAALVPADLQEAIKLLVAHFYSNRMPEIVGASIDQFSLTIEKIVSNYRLWV